MLPRLVCDICTRCQLLLDRMSQNFSCDRLAATLPASIIIPRAFAASAIPPPSVTVGHDWKQVSNLCGVERGKHTANRKSDDDRRNRVLRE